MVKDSGMTTSTVAASMVVLNLTEAVRPCVGSINHRGVVCHGIALALGVWTLCWVFWPHIGSRSATVRQWGLRRTRRTPAVRCIHAGVHGLVGKVLLSLCMRGCVGHRFGPKRSLIVSK